MFAEEDASITQINKQHILSDLTVHSQTTNSFLSVIHQVTLGSQLISFCGIGMDISLKTDTCNLAHIFEAMTLGLEYVPGNGTFLMCIDYLMI